MPSSLFFRVRWQLSLLTGKKFMAERNQSLKRHQAGRVAQQSGALLLFWSICVWQSTAAVTPAPSSTPRVSEDTCTHVYTTTHRHTIKIKQIFTKYNHINKMKYRWPADLWKCLTSLATREMQIELHWNSVSFWSEWQSARKHKTTGLDEDMAIKGYIAGGCTN